VGIDASSNVITAAPVDLDVEDYENAQCSVALLATLQGVDGATNPVAGAFELSTSRGLSETNSAGTLTLVGTLAALACFELALHKNKLLNNRHMLRVRERASDFRVNCLTD